MERFLSQKSFGIERANSQREMEQGIERGVSQKSMERVVSQRAIQMSASFPCKTAVVGFFCGVCISYLLFAAGASFRTATFDVVMSLHETAAHQIDQMRKNHTEDSQSLVLNSWAMGNLNSAFIRPEDALHTGKSEQRKKDRGPEFEKQRQDDQRISLLQSVWEAYFLGLKNENDPFWNRIGVNWSNVPNAPHIQNCEALVEASEQLDTRGKNGRQPPWSLWKGYLGLELGKSIVQKDQEEELLIEHKSVLHGPYPPWVEGGDEDNLPMTRRVQRDLWVHQHPHDCHDPQVRFLLTDWERLPGFGIGAQIAGMAGMLALAVNQRRILVTNHFNRADHEGCIGSVHSHWSCYFFPETSKECRGRALELASQELAWKDGIVTSKENYTTKEIWVGKIPRQWGKPWEKMQPTTEIDGKLLKYHRTRDRRWWRAQAVRYLMRFQTEYTCKLLNTARHQAFGVKAAKMVTQTLSPDWPKVAISKYDSEIDRYVWANHKPWAPRPLLSIHVRLGDKAAEMKMVGFGGYMNLAQHIREHFPNVKDIWLSTEMQVTETVGSLDF